MDKQTAAPLARLLGTELASVTFVRDYVQLGFDGPLLNALTAISVTTGRLTVASGQAEFRNRLCDLIGSRVTSMQLRKGESFEIVFNGGQELSLSLREEDFSGPEGVVFNNLGGETIVL